MGERAPLPEPRSSFTSFRPRNEAETFGDENPVGAVIAGKYRVERVLGEGAMGVVVAARHLELDELVAIKSIRRSMHSVPDVVQRFAREAKACARLQSDHIAKVLDVGVAESIGPYIVMEYLQGKDLARMLRESGPQPVRRAAEYVMQACEALALAHATGITHRDIKPENLFLTRRGELEIIKLLDFGISKTTLVGSAFGGPMQLTQTSSLMGTPLYMSPEQIRATHEVDHRTDIWSLGVVLFELLTARTVFPGETVTQVCALVLEAKTPRLVDHCSGAPAELGHVIERCLQKDPKDRYQNAAALAQALMPFAPSRARLHAERANSVLTGTILPTSSEPQAVRPSRSAEPTLDRSQIPVVTTSGLSRTPHKRRNLTIALVSIIAVSLGFVLARGRGDTAVPTGVASNTAELPVPAARAPQPPVVTAGAAEHRAAPAASVTPGSAVPASGVAPARARGRVRGERARVPPKPETPPPVVHEAAPGSPAVAERPESRSAERARLLDTDRRVRLLE
jgi:eukaryotic-like serine/threonine-protein kinase